MPNARFVIIASSNDAGNIYAESIISNFSDVNKVNWKVVGMNPSLHINQSSVTGVRFIEVGY